MQTCWWPLGDHWSVHLTSIHLPGCVWYGGLESHWSYLRYVADDANGKQIITADKTLYETLVMKLILFIPDTLVWSHKDKSHVGDTM